jgi:hypothetical protein
MRGENLRIGVASIACGLAAMALGAGSASAAEGDTFFVVPKAKNVITFAVRAGSTDVSDIAYVVNRIPCRGGLPGPTGMGQLDGRAPIVDGAFKDPWGPGPENGAVKGVIDGTGASGTLRLKFKLKKPGRELGICNSGLRRWTAKSVSEERWNEVREKRIGIPPPGQPLP